MASFIPTGPVDPAEDAEIPGDGWYPAIDPAALRMETGLGTTWSAERLRAVIVEAIDEVQSLLTDWRADRTAVSLAEVDSATIGGEPAAVVRYRTAVFCRVRSKLLMVTRDYDSTKSGHDRADALEATADDWLARSRDALSRLLGQPRVTVELI